MSVDLLALTNAKRFYRAYRQFSKFITGIKVEPYKSRWTKRTLKWHGGRLGVRLTKCLCNHVHCGNRLVSQGKMCKLIFLQIMFNVTAMTKNRMFIGMIPIEHIADTALQPCELWPANYICKWWFSMWLKTIVQCRFDHIIKQALLPCTNMTWQMPKQTALFILYTLCKPLCLKWNMMRLLMANTENDKGGL